VKKAVTGRGLGGIHEELKDLFAPVKATIQRKVAAFTAQIRGPLQKLKTAVRDVASLTQINYRQLAIGMRLSKDLTAPGAAWEYDVDASYQQHYTSNLQVAIPGAGAADAQVTQPNPQLGPSWANLP
jgi:hypothetical protein